MPVVNIGAASNDGTGDPLRAAFGKLNTAHDDLESTVTDVIFSGGKLFASRSEAVNFTQAKLRGAYRRIITIEGSAIVIRGHSYTTPDPLFATYPQWGIVLRFDTAGAVATIPGGDSPSGLDVPLNAEMVIQRNNSSNTVSFWRVIGAPVDDLETDVLKRDLNNRWWRKHDDRDIADMRAALRDSGILPLTNIAGTGDAITADFLPSVVSAGITSPSAESKVTFVVVATNLNPNPTITLGGVVYPIRDADGNTWPANGFVVGRSYTLRRRNTVLRVFDSGGGSATSVGDEAFRSSNPLDEIWYAILRSRGGTPWLGSYPDGTWMAPTAFGSIRWPGDDIVILETQAGDPILAIAPDGSLIFKQGS